MTTTPTTPRPRRTAVVVATVLGAIGLLVVAAGIAFMVALSQAQF